MAKTLITTSLLALAATVATASLAEAGGFSRGSADTTILYEDGSVDLRVGATFVNPQRDFDTIRGAAATDAVYSDNYWIPSAAAKVGISDAFSCALTYTQPFGAASTYGTQAQLADATEDVIASRRPNAVIEAGFSSNEYGSTCAVKMSEGKGNFYFLGGVFVQSIDYTEKKTLGTLNLKDDSTIGYRFGAAYEIPEIALRAELLYRSKIDVEAEGIFTPSAILVATNIPFFTGRTFASTGQATFPQSLELNLQSGIAPGWLAFGSIKWTDWSVFKTLDYVIAPPIGGDSKVFNWKDGWTVSAGVGHSFTDTVSGALSLTWDKGVGTGADIMTDTWTLGAGAQIKGGPGVLRIGAAASYLTAGAQRVADGASFDATANGDWAYAGQVSYLVKF